MARLHGRNCFIALEGVSNKLDANRDIMEEEVRSKLVSFLFKGGQWTHGTGTASATFSPFIFHLSFNSLEEICSAGEDFLGLRTHKAFQEIFEPDTPLFGCSSQKE